MMLTATLALWAGAALAGVFGGHPAGFTGLAVTVGSIVTLFVVMQMTARINWSTKFQLNEGVGGKRTLQDLRGPASGTALNLGD